MFTITADELPRFMKCNGSRIMAASVPDTYVGDTTVRDEGNAAHYMATAVAKNEFTIDELVDRKAPNGIYMSMEMAEHVQAYLDSIAHGDIEVETSFGSDLFRVNARADHVAHILASDTLYIDDLKYGWRLVEPEEHWTLIAHAIGYCISHQIAPANIVMVIHQPRPWHRDGKRREWKITYAQLMEYYAVLQRTLNAPSDELHTGSHCHNCPALATCPAAAAAGMNAIDASALAFNDEITDAALAFELDTLATAAATIKRRLEALEELAKHRIQKGAVIQLGDDIFTLEKQYGHRAWHDNVTYELILMLTNVDIRDKPKLITPTQAIKKGINEATVKSFSDRRETGLKLARENVNKRAERLFKKEK